MAGPIEQAERRDILDGVGYSRQAGRELDTTINFQPVHLDEYPDATDMGRWFRNGILRAVATFFARETGAGWWGFATRESYVGYRREHLHVVLWCPPRLRGKLLAFLRRRYPGGTAKGRMAVHMGSLDEEGGTEYRLKQQTGGAAGPLRPGRPIAEVKSRFDGAPVAEVFGKRYIVSRAITLKARTDAGWQAHRDTARAERAIKAKQAKADAKAREARQVRIDHMLRACTSAPPPWELEPWLDDLSAEALAAMPTWWPPLVEADAVA